MEVRIKGKEEFIRACTNDVLSKMLDANYIEKEYAPFSPTTDFKKNSGVIYRTKTGIIIMTDLTTKGR